MTDDYKNAKQGRIPIKEIVYTLAIGLLTGILTVVGQKFLSGSWNSLANSGAVWLIPAFFVSGWGKKMPWSIALCIESLIACVLSYYAFEAVMNGHAFEFAGLAFLWLVCAFIFGTVFGIGAYLFSQKKRYYHWGAGLLPAVFLAEGLIELIHLPDYAHMIPAVIGRMIIGTTLYIIIFMHELFSRKSLISFGVLVLLGVIGFEIIYRLT